MRAKLTHNGLNQRGEKDKAGPFLLIYLLMCLKQFFRSQFFQIVFPSNIEGFEIFRKKFIYTTQADYNTVPFLFKILNLLYIYQRSLSIFRSQTNKSKCEIAGMGVLKGVKVALYGMTCVNVHEDTIKILGIRYSYNKQLENDENFIKYIAKTENVIKL